MNLERKGYLQWSIQLYDALMQNPILNNKASIQTNHTAWIEAQILMKTHTLSKQTDQNEDEPSLNSSW